MDYSFCLGRAGWLAVSPEVPTFFVQRVLTSDDARCFSYLRTRTRTLFSILSLLLPLACLHAYPSWQVWP